jgi:magnesium transporter
MWEPFDYVPQAVNESPGIEHEEITELPSRPGRVRVTCIDYAPATARTEEIADLDDFLNRHRPDWVKVRWIDVEGVTDMAVIHALATKYEVHPLAVEDLLHLRQRPKVESYGGDDSELRARLFIVARELEFHKDALTSEQISMLLGHNTLITFEEDYCQTWDPIRQRLLSKGSRLRTSDASFLAYSLLDAVVDHFYPILEVYSERMDELEVSIIEHVDRSNLDKIHQIKRDLLLLRWVAWPMREVAQSLQREPHECVSDVTRVYLRDLYDHAVQVIEIIETYRERASDLTDSYMSGVSNRMNEIMKVLTIMSTLFIPLTFLAGVFGMNFEHFPELKMTWAYPAFWVVCVVLASIMLMIFRRRKWI